MKLIHLIFAVAVCFNGAFLTAAQDNFSLWPRRPDELEKARRLLAEQKRGEAVRLLQPFVHDGGVAGVEARQITSSVNAPRYLSRLHPYAKVYAVKRGDTLPKIAAATKCPVDVLMMLNGLVEPSDLKIGQKVVYISMELRMEIYPSTREICVWDGESLVASYKIMELYGVDDKITEPVTVEIASRQPMLQGKAVPVTSAQAASADKAFQLSDGVSVTGTPQADGRYVLLSAMDANELALLLRAGNMVIWAREPQGSSPISAEKQ